MSEVVHVSECDFYTGLLTWGHISLEDMDISDMLIMWAWRQFRSDFLAGHGTLLEWGKINDLAGDTYITRIELDGPTVKVIITDESWYIAAVIERGKDGRELAISKHGNRDDAIDEAVRYDANVNHGYKGIVALKLPEHTVIWRSNSNV